MKRLRDLVQRRPAPLQREIVGWCGRCAGPLLYAPEHLEATCPCGACSIPASFMRLGGGLTK